MKKLFLISYVILVSASLYSQAPEGFSYNAIVRNSAGDPIVSQAVSFRFSIFKGSPAGIVVYEEKHYVNTDNYGGVSLVIGNGTDKIGDFAVIDWGADIYFLNIELDITGGTNYTDMGTTQLQSVPYALYANTAANGFSGDYNDLTNKPVTDGSETKITVGNNLTVAGSGTIDDPYLLNARRHYVGEPYGGGIVYYTYDNGRHGLIASLADQDPGIEWYNDTKRYTNTTGDGIGAGEMNTTLIIALQTNDNPLGNFAAKVCADYSVTVDGVTYGDWYLPSKFELALLFNSADVVGGFANNYYWSSTEFSSVSAWCLDFSIGSQDNLNKSLPYGVRAIRSF